MQLELKRFVIGALGIATLIGTASTAGAMGLDAPPMWATYPSYTGYPVGGPAAGPFCSNIDTNMPAGRQSSCGQPVRTRISAGLYTVEITNGAPLPLAGSASPGNDSGYAVFVTAVGSNAICSEAGFQTTGNNLKSTIQCVKASDGTAVDSEFSWTYRTDSTGYWQYAPHPFNLIFARVNRGSPSQFVSAQTFNPFPEAMTTSKVATGQFQLTFSNVNGQSSNGDINFTTGMNNVIVQRTCANDTSETCKRAVCIPSSWTTGSAPGSGLTLEVRCYASSGSAVNVDFRVLIANESHTSQMTDFAGSGMHYAWLNSPTFTKNECKDTTLIKHRAQHETPGENYPTTALHSCRTGTGTYRTTFESNGFYHVDSVSALVSSRATQGTYCNVSRVDCANSACNASPPPFVDVKCYDRTGAAVDALWNLSIVY